MKTWYIKVTMCAILGIGTPMKAQETTYKILDDVRKIKVNRVSDNGEWIGYGKLGSIFYYNTKTEESRTITDAENQGISICGVSNSGILLGSFGANALASAAFYKSNKWTVLPVPDERRKKFSQATGMTEDESLISGYVDGNRIQGEPMLPCIWKFTDGEYRFEAIPQPDKDITGETPQGSSVRDLSADGSVLVGIFISKDGFIEIPIIWTREENGTYTYKVWGEELVYNLEAENPGICPTYENWVTAPQGTPEFEKQYATWKQLSDEYYLKRQKFYSGRGAFELRNIAVSRNGRWVVVAYLERGNPKELQAYRIDLQNNSVVIYNGDKNTCPRSVLDDGTVIAFSGFNGSIQTGQVYKDEKEGQIPLYMWIKEKTGIDLSEDFLFNISVTDPITGEVSPKDSIVTGCCTISKDGSTVLSYLTEPENFSYIINYFVRKETASGVLSPSTMDESAYVISKTLYVNGDIKKLELMDVTGKKVYASTNVEEATGLDFLQKGVYLARLFTGSGKTITKKILVE